MDPIWHPHVCDGCGAGGTFSRCSRCQEVFYCSAACQAKAWRSHHSAECKMKRAHQLATKVARKWMHTGTIDLDHLTAADRDLLVGSLVRRDAQGHLQWEAHQSFGEYYAAKSQVDRVVRIVDHTERQAEIDKLRSKHPRPSSRSEPVFLTFFEEMLEDERKKRGFK